MIYMIRYQYRNDFRKTLPEPIPTDSIGVYGLSLTAPFECVFIHPDGTREPSNTTPPLLAERATLEITRKDCTKYQRQFAEFLRVLRAEFEADDHGCDWRTYYVQNREGKPAPIYSPKPERSFVLSPDGEKLDPLTRIPLTYMYVSGYSNPKLLPRFRTPDGRIVPLSTDRNGGYRSWSRMKARPGVTICPRWRKSFGAFFEDMGAPPIEWATDFGAMVVSDTNHYGPETARWAPSKRGRANVELWQCPFTGEKLPLADLCKRHGQTPCRVRNRVRQCKWTLERALLDDPRPHERGIGCRRQGTRKNDCRRSSTDQTDGAAT